MIYEYECDSCDKITDIVKPAAQYNWVESCTQCSNTMTRLCRPKIHLYGTAVEDKFYSKALGEVVDHRRQERAIAKSKGLIEVGNENVKKHTSKPKLGYGKI